MNEEDDKIDWLIRGLIGIWIIISLAVGIYVGNKNWQETSIKEAEYRSLGWKTLNSKIVKLDGVNGNFKPISQTATLEYRYVGELPVQTQQQVALGYHNGDNVGIYANKNGEVQVQNAPNPNRPSQYLSDPTYKSFDGDYTGNIMTGVGVTAAVAGGLFIAAVLLLMVVGGIVLVYDVITSKKEKQSVTS